MKSISIVGLILLAVSALLFYLTTDFTVERVTMSHMMGMMGGIGIGLIIGGMVGYASKGNAIKLEQQKQEYKRLQQEKEDLEKKALDAERLKTELEEQNKNRYPQM